QRAAEVIGRFDAAAHPAAAVVVDEDRERAGGIWRVDAHGDLAVRPGHRTILDLRDGWLGPCELAVASQGVGAHLGGRQPTGWAAERSNCIHVGTGLWVERHGSSTDAARMGAAGARRRV